MVVVRATFLLSRRRAPKRLMSTDFFNTFNTSPLSRFDREFCFLVLLHIFWRILFKSYNEQNGSYSSKVSKVIDWIWEIWQLSRICCSCNIINTLFDNTFCHNHTSFIYWCSIWLSNKILFRSVVSYFKFILSVI